MAQAPRDENRVPTLIGVSSADNATPTRIEVNPVTNAMLVEVTNGSGNGYITDGVDTAIIATVKDLANSNPLTVAIVDATGDQITSFGGGTQYTEGDTDATITGTATMMEVAANVLQPVQGTVAGGLLVNLGTNNDVTVTASDLDVRDLTSVSDNVEVKQATGTNLHTVVDSGTITTITNAVTVNAHAVTNAGTFAVQVDGSALTSLQLIDDAIYAEDVAHNTGDKGVFMLAIRNSDNSVITTNQGDYSPISVDDTGRLQVVINSGQVKVTGNISSGDADSGEPVKVGGKYVAAGITLDNNDRGDLQLDVAGNLKVSGTTLSSIDTSTASKYITGIGHGVTTVTTAGTDVALAASTVCKKVTIQAQTDNTSLIAVGASGVDATIATGTGVALYPGDVFEFDIDNLDNVYIDSLVNGEGVRFTYFT